MADKVAEARANGLPDGAPVEAPQDVRDEAEKLSRVYVNVTVNDDPAGETVVAAGGQAYIDGEVNR